MNPDRILWIDTHGEITFANSATQKTCNEPGGD
jgi:hypothetical protein